MKAVRAISLQTVHGEAWSKSRDVRYYRLLDDCLTAYFEEDDGSPATRE